MIRLISVALLLGILTVGCSIDRVDPPEEVLPVPSTQQLLWHEMEYYAFIHFGPNTFMDMEWGYGDEDPAVFDPSQLDCRQWARIIKAAGMKGVIVGAKHHDGFCLWPYKGTEHSVKNSPWREGKGDLLRELRDACDEYDLKMGLYLSPWDRNHAEYARPEYLEYFRNQLRDILANYGETFEVWFDGANGGSGFYGGADEIRKIDKKTYYDWVNTMKLVYEFQPDTIVFSDKGPGARWIGNERGYAGETNWSLLNPGSITIGGAGDKLKMLNEGDENGTHWIPGEADVSIRPGWFYHQSQDDKVKTLEHLLDIYYGSVGRNSNLLLNIPIDKRGLIHENDEAALIDLKAMLDQTFAHDLAEGTNVEATNSRGNHEQYSAANVIDDNKDSYWATDDGIIQSSLTINFGRPVKFNRFLVQEYIRLGQRIRSFQIEALIDKRWEPLSEATTIGYKRILCFPMVESQKLRMRIKDAKASPVISNIEVYKAPEPSSNGKIY